MAQRNAQRAEEARDELRRLVGFSAADEIEKLDKLKKTGQLATPSLHGFGPISFNRIGFPCWLLGSHHLAISPAAV